MLYRSTDRLCRCGAPMKNLAHSASFESLDKNAPSKPGTKHPLYTAFQPAEARRVLRRLEFHYTPKHASWLNMVEIEIGVLKGQCLDRRIESCDRLVAEIDAWQSQRNQSGARINWMFSTDKARTKMARAYPDPPLKES